MVTEEAIKTYLQSLPPSIFNLNSYKSLQCSTLEKGLHNLNFELEISDGDKICLAVLRVSASAKNQHSLVHEAWYLEKLIDIAPRVLFHADSSLLGGSVLITEFIPGAHIDFNKLSDSQIIMLAITLARNVHSIHANRYSSSEAALPDTRGTYRDYAQLSIHEILTQYDQAKAIPHDMSLISRARTLLEERLTSSNESWNGHVFSLCHGDLSIYNILWREHELRLIDWESVRFGDPADEVSYIFAINGVSRRWQNNFLKAYNQTSTQGDISSRVETYLLKNYLFDVVWAMGKLREEKEHSSLIRLEHGKYHAMYEQRLEALKQYLDS